MTDEQLDELVAQIRQKAQGSTDAPFWRYVADFIAKRNQQITQELTALRERCERAERERDSIVERYSGVAVKYSDAVDREIAVKDTLAARDAEIALLHDIRKAAHAAINDSPDGEDDSVIVPLEKARAVNVAIDAYARFCVTGIKHG